MFVSVSVLKRILVLIHDSKYAEQAGTLILDYDSDTTSSDDGHKESKETHNQVKP